MAKLSLIFILTYLSQVCFSQMSGLDLDMSFGINGSTLVDVKDYDYTNLHLCDEQGNVFVLGASGSYSSGVYDFDATVIKLNAQGNLDTSFANNGILTFDFPGKGSANISHGLVHDNNIYLIGAGYDYGVADSQTVFIAKLDSIGNVDPSFGQSGFLDYSIFGNYNIPGQIALDKSDRLIYSFTALDTNYAHMEIPVMGRLYLDGSVDSTFAQDGQIHWHPLSGLSALGPGAVRHQDGAYLDKILTLDSAYLFCGYIYVGEAYAAFALMVDDTGAAVNTFGQSGQWSVNFNLGMNNRIHKAIEVDGNIWMLADINRHDGNKNLDLRIVNMNGVIQTQLSTDFLGNIDEVRDLMVDDDGNFIALSTSTQMTNNNPGYRGDFGLVHSWLPTFQDNTGFAAQGTGTFNPDTSTQFDPQSISGHLIDDEYIIASDRVYGQTNYSDFQVLKLLNGTFNASNINEKVSFKLYPNPSKGIIHIEGAEVTSIAIKTISGQTIKNLNNPSNSISLEEFGAGTYLIELKSEDGNTIHKKVVVH